MKKTLFYLFIALFSFAIISCGSQFESQTKSDDKEDQEIVIEEEIDISPEEAARITPADVDINTPIPVTQLYNSFFEWKDIEVTIAGYVRMYLDSDDFKENFQIVGEPESTDYLFDCTFAETPEGTINAEDLIIVKGTIKDAGYSGIELENCEFIGINEEYDDSKDLSPYRMPKKPIFAKNLFDAYNSWIDVEVLVIGYYNSTTTSTLSDNVIWRIDLADPESKEKKVGCRMKEEPDSEFLKDFRDDVAIRGIIKEEAFGRVLLEECEIIKLK